MSRQYATPVWLRRVLEDRLRYAGFEDAACTKVRYGVTSDGRPALITSVFRYASVRMPVQELEGYERALLEMPGVVATKIVHEDTTGLRDQVYVTHLRIWEDPEEPGEVSRG